MNGKHLGAIFTRLILCMLCLLAGACERPAPQTASSEPSSVTPTLRLVPASPALAVILRDLGLGDKIVARHGFDAFSSQDLPVIGSQDGLDYEALLRVRPTHVLLEWGQRPLPPRLQELADTHGWKLSNHTLLSLADIRATTLQLREWFSPPSSQDAHGPSRAPTTQELAERFDRAWSPREGPPLSGAGRVLLLAAIDPPSVFGPGSCHHQLLEQLGATPAITSGSAWITLDAEAVLRLAPDAIVMIMPRAPGSEPEAAPTPADLATRMGRIGWLDIPAVRNDRLALIDDPLCQTPGTCMVALGDNLDRVIRAWIAK